MDHYRYEPLNVFEFGLIRFENAGLDGSVRFMNLPIGPKCSNLLRREKVFDGAYAILPLSNWLAEFLVSPGKLSNV